MMGDMSKDAVKRYRPAVHTDGAACMVDCKIGFWVSKPDYDDLAAELAEADAMIEAQQKDYASNNVRFAEAEHRAKVAEAALPAVYRLALGDAAAAVRKAYNATENFYSMMSAPSALPTPTAAELMARINEGEKE